MRASAFLALTLVTSASAVTAGPLTASAPVQHVSYADLDLTSDAGKASLHRRVLLAIGEVCGGDYSSPLAAQAATKACKRHALASAQRQMTVAVANAAPPAAGEKLVAVR